MTACGPSLGSESAALAELCGENAPVQLLPLGQDEAVTATPHAIVRNGDRWLIGVHTEVDTGEDQERIVSVDDCGGDANVVAEGYDQVLAPPRAGLPWVACRQVGVIHEDMAWFDPEGRVPPRSLGSRACQLAWVGDEVVFAVPSGDAYQLTVARFDAAGEVAAQEVLANDISTWAHRTPVRNQSHTSYAILSAPRVAEEPTGHLYAVTTSDELLDVEVGTRQLTVVGRYAGGIRSIVADDQIVAMRGESAFVVDLAQGDVAEYADVQSGINGGPYLGSGSVTVTRNSVANGNTYAVTRGDMLDHVLPSTLLYPVGEGDGGRIYFFGSTRDHRGLFTWRPDSPIYRTESPEFLAGPALSAWHDGDLYAVTRWTAEPSEDEPEYDLVRFVGPSLTAEVLFRDVYDPLPLPGGRWVSVREDSETSGALTVLTPGDDRGTVVDEGVDRELAAFQGGPARAVDTDTDATVVYVVTRGGRRGVWLLELEPS